MTTNETPKQEQPIKMTTNETLMQDTVSQLYNMWMQAETPTTARHYHNAHDMVLERLRALQKDGKIVNIKESDGHCPICMVRWDVPNNGAYSFCCDCGIRIHDQCKILMYSAEYVEDMRCGYCRGKDELFQRDADFWGGRWRRQELLEAGKIMKCEYRLPAGNDVQKSPGGGKLRVGWFWADDSKYNESGKDQTGIVHLPRVKIGVPADKTDMKRHFADYIC